MHKSAFLPFHPRLAFEASDDSGAGGTVDPEGGVAPDASSGDAGTSDEVTPAKATDQAGYEPPFNLNDVDETIRPEVERYVKQAQAAFTRKTQELADKRAELGDINPELIPLLSGLNEDNAEEVINGLAERYGLEPVDNSEPGAEPDQLQTLEQRIAAQEQRAQSEDEAAKQDGIRRHVFGGIESYEQEMGLPDGEHLSTEITQQLIANALALPQLSNGNPDIGKAIENWKAAYETVSQEAVQRYLDGKKGVNPDASGASGVQEIDTSTQQGRLKKANAVAERTLAEHSPH